MNTWNTSSLDGRRGFKLVPGCFPPIRHFRRIAGARDLKMVEAVEAMTDDQARDEIGRVELISAGQRYTGGNSERVMAAFTVFDHAGSLLSDGSYGLSRLQMLEPDAIAEAQREFTAFLAATGEKPIKLRLGLYSFGLSGEAADLRAAEGIRWEQLTNGGSAASREIGRRLRAAGIAAALYSNPSCSGAESLAVFTPSVFTDCKRDALVELNWNGQAIDSVSVVPGLAGVRKLNEFKWQTRLH